MLSKWERGASPPSSPGDRIAAWWNVWPCGLPSVGTGETERPSAGEGQREGDEEGEEEDEEEGEGEGEGERPFGVRGSGRLLGFDSADLGSQNTTKPTTTMQVIHKLSTVSYPVTLVFDG